MPLEDHNLFWQHLKGRIYLCFFCEMQGVPANLFFLSFCNPCSGCLGHKLGTEADTDHRQLQCQRLFNQSVFILQKWLFCLLVYVHGTTHDYQPSATFKVFWRSSFVKVHLSVFYTERLQWFCQSPRSLEWNMFKDKDLVHHFPPPSDTGDSPDSTTSLRSVRKSGTVPSLSSDPLIASSIWLRNPLRIRTSLSSSRALPNICLKANIMSFWFCLLKNRISSTVC